MTCTCEVTPAHLCPEHMDVGLPGVAGPTGCGGNEVGPTGCRTDYVAGFLFSPSGQYVALIRKTKPQWQAGRLNAIGGKIEPGETPLEAMQREFKEEAGLDVTTWRQFCTLTGLDFRVFFFEAVDSRWAELESLTAEVVGIYDTKDLRTLNIIPNLKWLVPLALDREQLIGEVRDPGNR